MKTEQVKEEKETSANDQTRWGRIAPEDTLSKTYEQYNL